MDGVTEDSKWGIVVPGHSRRGRLSAACRTVLAHAAEVAEARAPDVIVFTGWSPRGGASEAEQMLDAWEGRRDVEFVVEPTARITAQNAARSLPILLSRDVRAATIVCAPLHARRVRYFFSGLFEDAGVRCDVEAAPLAFSYRALAWELAASAVQRRQLRSALAEVEATRVETVIAWSRKADRAASASRT